MKQENRLLEALEASNIGVAITEHGYLVDSEGNRSKYGQVCGNGNRTVEELDEFLYENGIECKPVRR